MKSETAKKIETVQALLKELVVETTNKPKTRFIFMSVHEPEEREEGKEAIAKLTVIGSGTPSMITSMVAEACTETPELREILAKGAAVSLVESVQNMQGYCDCPICTEARRSEARKNNVNIN